LLSQSKLIIKYTKRTGVYPEYQFNPIIKGHACVKSMGNGNLNLSKQNVKVALYFYCLSSIYISLHYYLQFKKIYLQLFHNIFYFREQI